MWLPYDERHILAGLYRNIGEIGVEAGYYVYDLTKFLNYWGGYWQRILEFEDNNYVAPNLARDHLPLWWQKWRNSIEYRRDKRAREAVKCLALRGLITERPHQTDITVLIITLTLTGYDLGRKYSNCLPRSGVWFQEYQTHWLWLLAATIGGGIVAHLIDRIFRKH